MTVLSELTLTNPPILDKIGNCSEAIYGELISQRPNFSGEFAHIFAEKEEIRIKVIKRILRLDILK